MRPWNRRVAQIFQQLRKIWVSERKSAQSITVLPLLGNLYIFRGVLPDFCLRKTVWQKVWLRKKKLLLDSLIQFLPYAGFLYTIRRILKKNLGMFLNPINLQIFHMLVYKRELFNWLSSTGFIFVPINFKCHNMINILFYMFFLLLFNK